MRGRKRAATLWCRGESESSSTMRECCSCGGKNAGNAFWMRAQRLIGVYVVFFNVPASTTLQSVKKYPSPNVTFEFLLVILFQETCAM